MKIPLYVFIIAIILALLVLFNADKLKQAPAPNPMDQQYDSLMKVVNRMQLYIDRADSIISKRDTVIIKSIEYVKVNSENVYRLSSDSSNKLFLAWAEMFQDSSARARYLFTDSTGLYQ